MERGIFGKLNDILTLKQGRNERNPEFRNSLASVLKTWIRILPFLLLGRVLASVNLCQYMSTHGVSDWCYCPDIVNIWLHNVQRESQEIASLQQRHSTTILNFQQLIFDEWCWNTFIKNLCSQLKSLKTVMVALHSSVSTQNLPFPTNCKVLSSS